MKFSFAFGYNSFFFTHLQSNYKKEICIKRYIYSIFIEKERERVRGVEGVETATKTNFKITFNGYKYFISYFSQHKVKSFSND